MLFKKNSLVSGSDSGEGGSIANKKKAFINALLNQFDKLVNTLLFDRNKTKNSIQNLQIIVPGSACAWPSGSGSLSLDGSGSLALAGSASKYSNSSCQ